MEYDKYLVSLYDSSTFSGMSRGVLQVAKLSNKVELIFNTNFYHGFVFVLNKDSCHVFELEREQKYIFNDKFNFYDDYLFYIVLKDKCLFGRKGKIVFNDKLLNELKEKSEKLKDQAKQKLKVMQDKNFITDDIMSKVFGERSLLFFENCKQSLESLFSTNERNKELENIIPTSKFIRVVDDNYAGIVYDSGLPKCLAMGYSSTQFDQSLDSCKFQCFYKNDENMENLLEGYFLTFRRASDGEQVFI